MPGSTSKRDQSTTKNPDTMFVQKTLKKRLAARSAASRSEDRHAAQGLMRENQDGQAREEGTGDQKSAARAPMPRVCSSRAKDGHEAARNVGEPEDQRALQAHRAREMSDAAGDGRRADLATRVPCGEDKVGAGLADLVDRPERSQ